MIETFEGRIFTPQQFSEKLSANPSIEDSIVASTLMGVSSLRKDVARVVDGRHQYFEVYGDTVAQLGLEGSRLSLVESLEGNSDEYSLHVGLVDTLTEYTHNANLLYVEGDFIGISTIAILSMKIGFIGGITDLSTFLHSCVQASNDPEYYIDQIDATIENILVKFGSVKRFEKFLLDVPRRKGVQVLYGNGPHSNFVDFIRSVGWEQDTIARNISARIPSRIPPEFVHAVLVRGDYEKEELLPSRLG